MNVSFKESSKFTYYSASTCAFTESALFEMDIKKDLKKEVKSEVIIIDDSEEEKPLVSEDLVRPKKKSHKRCRKHKCARRRKVRLSRDKDTETLMITQEVKVKKQKIQCIVNLTNTNICKHKKLSRKHPKVNIKSTIIKRTPPCCSREKCRSVIRKKTHRGYVKNRNKKPETRHSRKSKPCRKIREKSSNYLSPVSSTNLDAIDVPYEDVSSDNFTVKSDNDLDTLIKRTKDRLSTIQEDPLCTSTPNHLEDVSDTDNLSLTDSETSLHSVPTLILDTLHTFSPTEPPMSPYTMSTFYRQEPCFSFD